MPLPNTSMSFSPFAILTAEEMNDLVENIEALSDGTGFSLTSTALDDSNGNEMLEIGVTSSAVNNLKIANSATGTGPTISSVGGDTNVNLNLVTKGTGVVRVNGGTIPQSPTDLTSSISLQAGWSSSAQSLVKFGPLCWLSGFWTKSTNISNGEVAMNLPISTDPIAAAANSTYAPANMASGGTTARVQIANTAGTIQLIVRNPSSSQTTLSFSIWWIATS